MIKFDFMSFVIIVTIESMYKSILILSGDPFVIPLYCFKNESFSIVDDRHISVVIIYFCNYQRRDIRLIIPTY